MSALVVRRAMSGIIVKGRNTTGLFGSVFTYRIFISDVTMAFMETPRKLDRFVNAAIVMEDLVIRWLEIVLPAS